MGTIVRITTGAVATLTAVYVIFSGIASIAYLQCLEEPENVCSLHTAFVPGAMLLAGALVAFVLTLFYVVGTMFLPEDLSKEE